MWSFRRVGEARGRLLVELWSGEMDDQFDDDDDFNDEPEPDCHTCCGEGWVESVAAESGRHGWDTEGPGLCPNCGGSGLRKDCTTF